MEVDRISEWMCNGGKKMGIWENSVFLEDRNSCQLAQLSLFLTHNYLVMQNLNNGQHGGKKKSQRGAKFT